MRETVAGNDYERTLDQEKKARWKAAT